MRKYRDLKERLLFLSVLDLKTECWIFLGSKDYCGYGKLNVRRGGKHRTLKAHRVAWEEFVGEIPEDYDIDHLCKNRECINPEHLEPKYYLYHRLETGIPLKRK